MKILYHAINGTGLGHAMRLTAIASELLRIEPDAHQLIVSNAQVSEPFRSSGIPFMLLPEIRDGPAAGIDRRMSTIPKRTGVRLLYHAITEYQPDAVVFDTHYSRRLVTRLHVLARVRLVLVLRACRAEYLHEQLDGGLALFDQILVPHERAELEQSLGPELAHTLTAVPALSLVGPITRRCRQEQPGAKPAEEVLITCGAGGYTHSAELFLQRAAAAALAVTQGCADAVVTVVSGPYGRRLQLPAGCRQHLWLPDLDQRMRQARLVISHAGYNSVNEILAGPAAALLVPLARRHDDQERRAQMLAEEGRVEIAAADAGLDELIAACARALAAAPHAPRRCDGGARAAQALVDLVGPGRRLAWTGRHQRRVAAEHLGSATALLAALPTQPEQRVSVWIDADKLVTLTTLPSAGISVLEVELGEEDSSPAELSAAARAALAACDRLQIPVTKRSLIIDDDRSGTRLPQLARKLVGAEIRELIAVLPAGVPVDMQCLFEARERCRRLAPGFEVDFTSAARPRLGERI